MAQVLERRRAHVTASSPQSYDLAVPTYDRAASLLISLLMLLGLAVLCLFLTWLSTRMLYDPPPVPTVMAPPEGPEGDNAGRPDGEAGASMPLEGPDSDVISLETDLAEPEIAQTLAIVSDVAATQFADFSEAVVSTESDFSESGRAGWLIGTGTRMPLGNGSGRPGPVGRGKRWQIVFREGQTLREYGRQLDFFKIELGVISTTGLKQVEYALNLGLAKPDRRAGPDTDEKRLYMKWDQGPLQDADRQLLQLAGISTDGKVSVQFYHADTEQLLANLELAFANRKPAQIRRTRFGVRPVTNGYEFYVIDQTPT